MQTLDDVTQRRVLCLISALAHALAYPSYVCAIGGAGLGCLRAAAAGAETGPVVGHISGHRLSHAADFMEPEHVVAAGVLGFAAGEAQPYSRSKPSTS